MYTCIYIIHIHIYIYIYIYIDREREREREGPLGAALICRMSSNSWREVCVTRRWKPRPSQTCSATPKLPTLSLLRSVDSNFPGNPPSDMRIPPLDMNIMLKSKPPKSRILARRLAVLRPAGQEARAGICRGAGCCLSFTNLLLMINVATLLMNMANISIYEYIITWSRRGLVL